MENHNATAARPGEHEIELKKVIAQYDKQLQEKEAVIVRLEGQLQKSLEITRSAQKKAQDFQQLAHDANQRESHEMQSKVEANQLSRRLYALHISIPHLRAPGQCEICDDARQLLGVL